MKTKTKLLIIAICVIALVAVLVSPTSALYYQEMMLEAGLVARTFNIDDRNDDTLKLNIESNDTFHYGFFTETTNGVREMSFKIDFNNTTYSEGSTLDNADIVFSKKVGNAWVALTPDSDGYYVDKDVYAGGGKGLYSLAITNLGSEKLKGVVPVVISSNAVEDVDMPDNGTVVPTPEGYVVLEETTSVQMEKGDGTTSIRATLDINVRTDSGKDIIIYVYDKKNVQVTKFSAEIKDGQLNIVFFDEANVNNGSHLRVQIFVPKSST